MEDLINNYFTFFVEFKYHGVTSKRQCVEKCTGLFSGLPTVSQLDRFSEMVAGKEDWIHLCDPTRTYLDITTGSPVRVFFSFFQNVQT